MKKELNFNDDVKEKYTGLYGVESHGSHYYYVTVRSLFHASFLFPSAPTILFQSEENNNNVQNDNTTSLNSVKQTENNRLSKWKSQRKADWSKLLTENEISADNDNCQTETQSKTNSFHTEALANQSIWLKKSTRKEFEQAEVENHTCCTIS